MATSPKILMKRTYLDGQYIVIRKSEWLLQVTIEGPFGERASNGFIMWLNMLPLLNPNQQYILLDASNIGPVTLTFHDKLLEAIHEEKIGGVALFGGERAQENLAPLLPKIKEQEKIAFFTDLRKAFQFPEQLRQPTKH